MKNSLNYFPVLGAIIGCFIGLIIVTLVRNTDEPSVTWAPPIYLPVDSPVVITIYKYVDEKVYVRGDSCFSDSSCTQFRGLKK